MTMKEVEYPVDILDYQIYLSDSDISELDNLEDPDQLEDFRNELVIRELENYEH